MDDTVSESEWLALLEAPSLDTPQGWLSMEDIAAALDLSYNTARARVKKAVVDGTIEAAKVPAPW